MFLKRKSSCYPSQRNPLTKKNQLLNLSLSLSSYYLSLNRVPSASSSRLISSPYTVRVSSLADPSPSPCLPASVSASFLVTDLLPLFTVLWLNPVFLLPVLMTDWPCSSDCPLLNLLATQKADNKTPGDA